MPDDHSTIILQHFLDLFAAALPRDTDPTPAPGCFRVITREPHPLGNLLIIDAAVSPETVREQADPLRNDAFPAAAILTGGDLAGQVRALGELGFARAESMPLMSVTPDRLAPTTTPAGYTFREIGPEDDTRWSDAFAEGYQIPPGLAAMFAPAALDARGVRGRFYACEQDGAFAAVSLCYDHEGTPGIYAVATRPAHRGRGLAAHLTAEPLRRAWGSMSGPGVLQASAMGEPVYRRLGFEGHGHMALFVRVPGSG
jgi:GNAT superfamily N-acetyltransferase